MIEELRARAVQEIGGLPSHIRFRENVDKCHNPYGAEHHNRSLVETHSLPLQSETVYFVGCTSNYRETQIRDATISMLKKAGVDFTIVDEYCCCSPLIRTGHLGPVNEAAQHNADAIRAAGAKRIVTSCSGCYRTLSRDYPKLGIDLGVEVVHITQLLNELIDTSALVPKQTEHRSIITWHDPCHLGRAMGIYDAPRDVISKLPVNLVEMETTRENAWCCGGGGGAKAAYNDWSVETARMRVEQALRTGAELIVSACPFCTRNLRDGSSEDGPPVIDLTELVNRFI
jgi:Fe-S oxidoreductase